MLVEGLSGMPKFARNWHQGIKLERKTQIAEDPKMKTPKNGKRMR
jgi:hypothetical protein